MGIIDTVAPELSLYTEVHGHKGVRQVGKDRSFGNSRKGVFLYLDTLSVPERSIIIGHKSYHCVVLVACSEPFSVSNEYDEILNSYALVH